MNGKPSNESWKGYPADLMEMMIDVYLGDGAYSAAQVVNRLSAEIDKVDIESVSDSLERIAWVDRFMRDCAMDFICHPDLWENESGSIAALLSEADDLLSALCRSGTVELRAYKSGASDEDPTALAQRMNAYRCVSAALTGDVWEFCKRLSRAADDTKANVEHLLSCPCADELIEKEDTTRYGFYLPGQRYFTEPLASLADCAFHIGKSNYLARAYHEYIKFLEKLGADSRGVRGRLLLDAEHILGKLLDDERQCGSEPGFIPVDEVLPTVLPHWGAPRLREHCLFGCDHGGEPLSWDVLVIRDGKTLLLSDRIVDIGPYAVDDVEECAWEDSDLEEYVSTELTYDLFSSGERAYIEGAPRILSALEMERCYPRDKDRIAYPTAFAQAKGLRTDARGAGAYWTSTQGDTSRIAFVRPDGDIDARGWRQDDELGLGIRLAILLKVDVRAYSRHGQLPDEHGFVPWEGHWLEDNSEGQLDSGESEFPWAKSAASPERVSKNEPDGVIGY